MRNIFCDKIQLLSLAYGSAEACASKQNGKVILWHVLLSEPLHFSPHNNSLWLGCNNEHTPFQSC